MKSQQAQKAQGVMTTAALPLIERVRETAEWWRAHDEANTAAEFDEVADAMDEMLAALQLVLRGIERNKITDACLVVHSPDGVSADVVPISRTIRAAIAKATVPPSPSETK